MFKYQHCPNGCGIVIYYDGRIKSKNNKAMPIERRTKEIHNCPMFQTNYSDSGGSFW